MRLVDTSVEGVYELHAEPVVDPRGSFVPLFDSKALADVGYQMPVAQTAVSRNTRAGTLRGLHFQRPPYAEAKIVWCLRGAVFDVAVDVRRGSATYGQWHSAVLTPANGIGLAIPEGCAHGFMAMEDGSDVLYLLSQPYVSAAADGVAWDDPHLAITWPMVPTIMSDRDRNLQAFTWESEMRTEESTS